MKIKPKMPQNAEAESKSGVPSGAPSGVPSEDSNLKKNEDSNVAKAQRIVDLGYSTRKLSTLERLPTQELDFILREKRDPEKNEISKKTIEASKEVVEAFLEINEAVKQGLYGEPLNPTLKRVIQSQNTALSEIVPMGAGGKVGLVLLITASIALMVDSLYGLNRIKKLFVKEKSEQKQAVRSEN